MYLFNQDLDNTVISYVLNGSERWDFLMLKRLYIIFGKTSYRKFILDAKDYYFNKLYLLYHVTNFNDLLKKLIHKPNPQFYHEYVQFNKGSVKFESLTKRPSLIIKYLCLYHHYIWICTNRSQYETIGDTYSKINDQYKEFEYRFLKSKGIHNLKYYNLVHEGKSFYDNRYQIKDTEDIYKLGITKDIVDIECIKLID